MASAIRFLFAKRSQSFYLKRFEVEAGEFKKMIASLKEDNYLQDQFQGNYDSAVDNDTVIICDYHAIRGLTHLNS